MRRVPFLALLAVTLAACGAGRPAATTHELHRPSVGSFVRQGNRVCIDADRRILPIGKLTRNPKGWTRTAKAARQNLLEMRAIVPPVSRLAVFDRMLHDGAAVVSDLERIREDLLAADIRGADAMQKRARRMEDEVHTAAKHAGLTYCQQPLNNWPA